jgi:hypothetical protein
LITHRYLELGLVQRDVGLRLVDLRLEGARIDLEQQRAGLDLGPLDERHLHQIAGDAGANVDRELRLRASCKIDVISHVAHDRAAHDHDRRRTRGRLGRGSRTARGHAQKQEKHLDPQREPRQKTIAHRAIPMGRDA